MKALALVLALALGGCAATAPYKAAVGGMADTGDAVRANCIKSPLTPGEQALVDAWDFQREKAHALVEGK